MSSNDNDHHNQSHLQISDETLSKPSNEVLKRRSQLLNIMKPSLSLTSLPPQSPKEQSNETTTSTERPYNSLKKKRDIEQKELWRRSWESQNSVSTTATSSGRNDFWAAYNYIMDNSIIDSCREASGEAKSMNDTSGNTTILANFGDTISPFNMSQGSQGSQKLDPKRLRRWLREMESRVSKLPSLKEAMKLNADDLKKFSIESTELYREINSNGRFVAACIRSLEKQNLNKVEELQGKSLDCTEHDSLDTITTSTTNTSSSSSKRSENVLKALERRYHLLYLNAFEIQCMFEGLLDKRNFFESLDNQEFDTSDEEPIAKIPKIDGIEKFSSSKCNDEESTKDIDADSEDSPDEMECDESKGLDCVDSKTVPNTSPLKNSSDLIEDTDKSFYSTPKVTVVRRSKDISKFNRSNRKSKNCAIFYYKHIDSDNDQMTNDNENEHLVSETSEEEIWEYANVANTSQTLEDQQMIISSDDPTAIQSNESDSKINPAQQQKEHGNLSNTTQLITKEALRELVLEAETLVLQKINGQTTKKEYFLKEILPTSNVRKGMQKKLMEKNQKDTAKISRVQEWLKKNHDSVDAKNIQIAIQLTDCEASGEYTSSENNSDSSSEEITDSVATCLQGTLDQLQTSTEGLENASPVHKVKMRGKTNDNRRHSDRPWSVSCISQLTSNTRQSFSDAKVAEATNVLANFSISESALNKLQKYRTTSESDSKNCNKNAVQSVGSKNSLKKRKTKLRKKSISSNKKSDSGSDIHTNIMKTMSKSDSFNVSLMEDLSTAISMMSFMKENNGSNNETLNEAVVKTLESEDEQVIKTPDFKIGSLTSVYGNPYSVNLGSLAALANYNNENGETNEITTENLSSISEHNMWDNYMEKYNSEAYSEDRDIDGARKLLDFGDDYRNFIDSQSDCCSSLSAANQIDSLSPPRNRKNISPRNISLPSSNENSMRALRQQRIQELPEAERQKDWSANNFLENIRQRSNEYEFTNTTKCKPTQQSSKVISSSDDSGGEEEAAKENKLILGECEKMLEQTQTLQMANPQLLRPEDYDEIIKTCLFNIERLENISKSDNVNQKKVSALIASWNRLLNWSENAAGIRRLQQEIIEQKQLLCSMEITEEWVLNSEEAIREKIQELNSTLEELYKHRSNMLKLNASVHSYVSKETNKQTASSGDIGDNSQNDANGLLADEELHKFLKDEIVCLYAKWDSVNLNLTSKLESLKNSLICWKQFENGLEELKENLSKDRGALNGLKGAIEEGSTSPEELVDNVQQVSKLLSEKLENRIQTISSNEDFMLHPEAALKFIANQSSNPSYQSDSGISDSGFSELSERERRLIALKKIAKQLESALSPSSEVLKTITQRMEAAENELKVLQNTCRELILRTSTQLLKEQGIDISSHAQSQINVQIPIITIKPTKTKRSSSRRNKNVSKPLYSDRKSDVMKKEKKHLNNDTSGSELDEPETTQWRILKRIAKLAAPFQLTIVTLFCVAWLLEPRCCDTLNNLSMSLSPQLHYVNGPPPT